ncbi:MAG: dephospho-CoA kinase [Alphaproteobacteria bacterium]|jgi:dephospho-CoA kinase|nr:dephospho-CoA kinase [Alphaproteobacteria bacterium]
MKIIGITGYIGSGKSTVSKMFRDRGFYYFDSDSYVAKLNNNKEILSEIKKYFPQSIVNNQLDKKILKEILFKDYETNIAKLESIYHPYVIKKIKRLIFIGKILFRKFLLLEVPLLFEAKINELCDITILVRCSVATQIKRVMNRSKINIEDLGKIMAKQKKLNYDTIPFSYIINTDKTIEDVEKEVIKIIKEISNE